MAKGNRKTRSDKGKKRGKYKTSQNPLNVNKINDNCLIYNNDCRVILNSYSKNSIHAIVTDPPYGISFMNNKWDYEIPLVKDFKKMLRVLKPGSPLLCFASPRTYHRMAVNIEDAGFEIKDCLMWLYGGGFPKSQSVKDLLIKYLKNNQANVDDINKAINIFEKYRTFSLKPAYEPIIMAMKPLEDNYANNALKYCCAGLNIEECRLKYKGKKWEKPRGGIWKTDKESKAILVDNDVGRFPSNLIYEGSQDVIDTLIASVEKSMNIKEKDFITRIFYCAKVKGANKIGNTHPTIKPISLMQYLCRLVKPPLKDDFILDPYMGSGSTGVACINEEIKFIGVEFQKEYFDIAKNRIEKTIEEKRNIFNEFM